MSISTANLKPRATQADFQLAAKTALLRKGQTITGLAGVLGLARNTVSIAINHPTMLPSVKRRIATALNLPS